MVLRRPLLREDPDTGRSGPDTILIIRAKLS